MFALFALNSKYTKPNVFSYDDLADVGTDEGTPVTNYGSSPKFTGKIDNVHIEVTGMKNENH